MNCVVCGNPLLCSRAVFHCTCGAFVHAYCWEKHILQAHQPTFETGIVNLSDEFIANESEEVEEAPSKQVTSPTEGELKEE